MREWEWTSVKERMPATYPVGDYEESGKVLCLAGGDWIILNYNIGEEDGGWETWYSSEYEDSVDGVTHWQVLPEKII